jgi:hypothetical protein
VQELVAGQKYVLCIHHAYAELIFFSAIKQFVLSQGWRNARYVVEPGYVLDICCAYASLILNSIGVGDGLLETYATACERIA